MALGVRSSVLANHDAVTIHGPESHGSRSTEKAPLAERRSEGRGWISGEKIRRKDESPFSCRTVTDIGHEKYGLCRIEVADQQVVVSGVEISC